MAGTFSFNCLQYWKLFLKFAAKTNRLPKGIYIKDGKKQVVK